MSFLIPNFSPKTITDLTWQIDEESALVQKEAELKAKFANIRDHIKDSEPLGVVRQQAPGPDEDADDNNGSMTGDESEQSQEEDEDNEMDGGQ